MAGDALSKALKSKNRGEAFGSLLTTATDAAQGASSFEEFDQMMNENYTEFVKKLLRLPLVNGRSDVVLEMVREKISSRHDLLYYAYLAAKGEFENEEDQSFGSRDKKRKHSDIDRSSQQHVLLTNTLALLHGVAMPLKKGDMSHHHSNLLQTFKKTHKDEVQQNTTLKSKARNKALMDGPTKLFVPSTYAKVFGEVWLHIFSLDLTKDVLLKVLETLHVDVIPYLPSPLVLFDFLCDAYNEGGLAGLLSLHGLFYLMTQHGLEFPQFYDKLYQMLTPDVCYSRYRFKFFELVGTFLITPGLSSAMVASFAKRLCRLALHAPTPAVFFIISLVKLLLIKHPQVMVIIHKDADSEEQLSEDDEDETVHNSSDPFVATEKLPDETKAINSSLWEIQGMLQHYNPTISATAKEFCDELRQPLGGSAPLIQARAGRTFFKMFQREILRELKGIPTVAYSAPIPFQSAGSDASSKRRSVLSSTFTF